MSTGLPLHAACEEQDIDTVKSLLKKKADVNQRDKNQWTPLHCAASAKNTEICRLLLKQGADPRAQTGNQTSALHYLARVQEPESDMKRNKDGTVTSPLLSLMKMMLDKGANINARNHSQVIPLHDASFRGQAHVVSFLCRNKSDVNSRDKHGETPLHYAMRSGNKDVIEVLLQSGASTETKGERGTPLDVVDRDRAESLSNLVQDLQNPANGDQALNKDGKAGEGEELVIANAYDELPHDVRGICQKAGIDPADANINFDKLISVLRFTTGKKFIKMDRDTDCFLNKEDPRKRFKMIETAGKGGFGSVFFAKDMATKERVAIKTQPHVKQGEKKRNMKEIRYMQAFDHPNIVRFKSSYDLGSDVWIVMEFMEGGTLEEAIAVRRFKEPEISFVARQILKALYYLHGKKLVHRDLKSSNVMLSVEGEVKLIDFGLTVNVAHGPKFTRAGSAYWMAPEVMMRSSHSYPVSCVPPIRYRHRPARVDIVVYLIPLSFPGTFLLV
eukprot:TRINITY_DN1069_c0_g1_i2.p1 TRINITY_DN1069_c0_g1~~TRINITY_DN1069_c0_g1_i2.p1  ORF type:complete len:533 (-),score=95.64 TRINITY_DN1069_c0_g1_i2:382-1884(-)